MIASKERVLAAINHCLSDRTPITFDAQKEVYEALYKHFGTESKEELFNKLNVDTWIISPKPTINSREEKDKEEKTTLWGYKTKTTHCSGGTYDELSFSPLAGKDDISEKDCRENSQAQQEVFASLLR